MDIELIGHVGDLQDDASPLQLGTRGRWKGRRFDVVGRIQLQFPAGYWNEWHLNFEGDQSGWLGEAQGTYVVTTLTPALGRLPDHGALKAGQPVQVNGENMTVKDIQVAMCIGGEGELPFKIEGGYMAPVVDLGTAGRRFATIDYSEDPPLLFLGESAEFDELQFENLKPLEGW
jgi:hypothetical protein